MGLSLASRADGATDTHEVDIDHGLNSPADFHGLNEALYRFHGTTVIDIDGKRIGQIDWIWTNGSYGRGEFIGINLRWLRGTARAVPVHGLSVDSRRGIVRLPYQKAVVAGASRFAIAGDLTDDQRQGIRSWFGMDVAARNHRVAA